MPDSDFPKDTHPEDRDGDSDPPVVPTARPVAAVVVEAPRESRSPIYLDDISRRDAWIDIGLIVFVFVGLSVAAELVIVLWFERFTGISRNEAAWAESDLVRYLPTTLVVVRLGITILIITALLALRRLPAASVGLTARALLVDSVAGVVSVGVASACILGSMQSVWVLWPDVIRQMQENADLIRNLIPKMHPLALGALSLAVGLYEELLFRGFLMTRLRRATGSWVLAVLISSVVFILPHAVDQQWIALLPIGILSLCMSLVTIWRRSIVPAIIGHFLFDWVMLISIYYNDAGNC